jgi:hypothetical protein
MKKLFNAMVISLGLSTIILTIPYIFYLIVLIGLKMPLIPILIGIFLFSIITWLNLNEDGSGKEIK